MADAVECTIRTGFIVHVSSGAMKSKHGVALDGNLVSEVEGRHFLQLDGQHY